MWNRYSLLPPAQRSRHREVGTFEQRLARELQARCWLRLMTIAVDEEVQCFARHRQRGAVGMQSEQFHSRVGCRVILRSDNAAEDSPIASAPRHLSGRAVTISWKAVLYWFTVGLAHEIA